MGDNRRMSESLSITTGGMLFDMDGVLVSSIGSVNRCWRRWAAHYDVPNADTYEVPHGRRAIDIVKELRPDIDPIEGLNYIEDMELQDRGDLIVLPGVKALLESLPPERWAIVTSATRRLLLGRLQAAGLPIPSRIISADMVENGKPHPEPYQRGAALLGLKPQDCIVVEDAPSGVGSGIAAGSRVLGVLGTHTADDLQHADWIVRSLEDVTATTSGTALTLHLSSARITSAPEPASAHL
jgi:sugar-phosphatase